MEDLNIPTPPQDIPKSPAYKGTNTTLDVGASMGNYKAGEFKFTMKQGFDPYKYRAQSQGFGEQLAKTVGNSILNVATGIGEFVGYGGALITEWGTDRDYSNAMTEAMKAMKNPFGEVYRTNPELMVDPTDAAWYLNTFGDLATSIATFAIPGAGLAKVFQSAAKAAALAMDGAAMAKIGMTTGRLLSAGKAAAQVASAASLSYAEGAMSGLDVYEKTYKAQYDKAIKEGKDEVTAKEFAADRASNAASTTVQLNTIMNTGLNMIQMLPFFHNADDAVRKWTREEAVMRKGESAKEYADRMKNFAAGGPNAQNYLKSLYRPYGVIGESASESLEELNNQFAEKTGYAVGQSGKKAGAFSQLKELENYFDRTMDAEGAYAAALGAIGGAGTTVFVDYVPIHRVDAVGADGKLIPKMASDGKEVIDPVTGKTKYKKTFVSGITRKYNGQAEYMNSIADSLAKDADWFHAQQEDLKKAVNENRTADAELIRNNMTSIANLNAVQLGMAENVKQMYQQMYDIDDKNDVGAERVAEIDKQLEQASQIEDEAERNAQVQALEAQKVEAEKLVGKSSADLAGLGPKYKVQAQRAMRQIDIIQKAYNEAEADYGFETSDKETGVMDYMYRKKAHLKLLEENIKNLEEDHAELSKEFNTQSRLNIDRNSLQAADAQQAKEYENANKTRARLVNDRDMIRILSKRIIDGTATDTDRANFNTVMQKYGAIATGTISGDTNATLKTIDKEIDRYLADKERIDQLYAESIGFEDWKKDKPNATLQDYFKAVSKQFGYSEAISQMQESIESSKSQLAISAAQMKALETEGLKKLREVMKTDREKAVKAEEERMKKEIVDTQNASITKIAEADLWEQRRQNAIQDIGSRIATLQGELKSISERVNTLRQKKRNMLDRFFDATIGIERDLTKRIANINAEIQGLQEKRFQEEQATPPEVTPTPVGAEPAEDASQEAEEAAETQPEEEVTEPAPFPGTEPVTDEAVRMEQIENWKAMARNKNMYLTIPELKELLASATLNELSDEEMQAIVEENLIYVRDIVTTAAEAFSDVVNMLFAMPISSDSRNATANAIEDMGRSLEDPRSEVPTDTEIVNYLNEQVPALEGLEDVPFLANRLKQAIDAMHQQDLMYEEVASQAMAIVMSQRANNTYDPADMVGQPTKEPPPPAIGEGPVEAPFENFNTQPAAGKDSLLEADKQIHLGLKSTAGTHLAASTLEYTEDSDGTNFFFVDRRFADGRLMLNENNERLLDPKVAAAGSQITFRIEKDNTDGINAYDAQGKIKMDQDSLGSFSIAIYGADGVKLGYLHTTKWVRESRINDAKDAEQFRNIGGNAEDVAKAEEDLLNIRTFIANAYNRNSGDVEFTTTVTDKGTGITHLHREQESSGKKPEVKEKSAATLLPDTSLRMGVLLGGAIKLQWNEEMSAEEAGIKPDQAKAMNGQAVAILPTANGKFTYAALYRSNLAPMMENSVEYKTVLSLFDMFLKGEQTEDTDKVKEITGHDPLTELGLKAILNEQFTETSLIKDTDLLQIPNANQKLLLQIKGNTISLGRHGAGQSLLSVNKKDTMSDKFKQQLLALMNSRLRVAAITNPKIATRGLNSEGKFNMLMITEDGVKSREFANYNEFFKATTTTIVDGTARDAQGNYRYTSNPKITFNLPGLKVVAKPTTPIVSVATTPEEDSTLESDIDFFSGEMTFTDVNNMIVSSMEAIENEDSPNVIPLTEETLESLYNKLPASERNGKTVDEVKRERISLGYTFIVVGDNPFRRCS